MGIQAGLGLAGVLAGLVLTRVVAAVVPGLVLALLLTASALGIAKRQTWARMIALGVETLFVVVGAIAVVRFLQRDVFVQSHVDPATAAAYIGLEAALGLGLPAIAIAWLVGRRPNGEQSQPLA